MTLLRRSKIKDEDENKWTIDDSIKEIERMRLCNDETLQLMLSEYRRKERFLKEIKEEINHKLEGCKNKFEDLI